MKDKSVFNVVAKDRRDLINRNKEVGLIKKLCVDMVLKLSILIVNSIGKREPVSYIFIDEIKNRNMSNNLYDTSAKFDNKKVSFLKFYEINKEDHIKIGIFLPIILLLSLYLQCILAVIFLVFGSRFYAEGVLRILKFNYQLYYSRIKFDNNAILFTMTDHHFYSSLSIFFSKKINKNIKSIVLQHGAIVDISYYYPIYADYFFSWGIKSKEKLNDDVKAIVTGTYKFCKLLRNDENDTSRYNCYMRKYKILWALSTPDSEKNKITLSTILKALDSVENAEFELIIKKHPSSYSTFSFIKSVDCDKSRTKITRVDDIIDNIEFDIAIISNSSIGYDLFVLNKVFIELRDKSALSNISYQQYGIRVADSDMQLKEILLDLMYKPDNYFESYSKSRENFIKEELNDNICTIVQTVDKLI